MFLCEHPQIGKAKSLASPVPSAICRELPLVAHVPSFTKGLGLQSSSRLTSWALIWIYAQIVWSSGIKPRRVYFILFFLLKGGWESRLPESIWLTCISSLLKPADSFKPSLNQTFVVKIYWELLTNEKQNLVLSMWKTNSWIWLPVRWQKCGAFRYIFTCTRCWALQRW